MTTHSEKIRQTIIEKHGSIEAYNEYRYGSIEDRKKRMAEIGRKGGKNSTARGFRDIEGLAKRAAAISAETRKK